MATKANKTTETNNSVTAFLKKVKDEQQRKDCAAMIELIEKNTGYEPKMWGTAIIGFGSYHYQYDSGREGDMCLVGLSPRAAAISLYVSGSFEGRDELLKKFGKHKTGKGCIYIKKLEDIDTKVLVTMVKKSIAHTKKMYPAL
ncbi:MAG: DUF1801 domain-containing protein [Bacteroidetes bacterium]|nr:DUF1801 domain-containing protein [Bacteroidota bacterium]